MKELVLRCTAGRYKGLDFPLDEGIAISNAAVESEYPVLNDESLPDNIQLMIHALDGDKFQVESFGVTWKKHRYGRSYNTADVSIGCRIYFHDSIYVILDAQSAGLLVGQKKSTSLLFGTLTLAAICGAYFWYSNGQGNKEKGELNRLIINGHDTGVSFVCEEENVCNVDYSFHNPLFILTTLDDKPLEILDGRVQVNNLYKDKVDSQIPEWFVRDYVNYIEVKEEVEVPVSEEADVQIFPYSVVYYSRSPIDSYIYNKKSKLLIGHMVPGFGKLVKIDDKNISFITDVGELKAIEY